MALIEKWNHETPFRLGIERNQALLEIDVLVAMELNLELEELISIYKIQFPVLASNQTKMYFDKSGNIINSTARNEYLVDKENNIMKESYQGYFTPFKTNNRIEDYRVAWKHFKDLFASKNTYRIK
jgi:hypothetical protein